VPPEQQGCQPAGALNWPIFVRRSAAWPLPPDSRRSFTRVRDVGGRREALTPGQGTSVGTPVFAFDALDGFGLGAGTGMNIDPITGLPLVNAGYAPLLSAPTTAPQPAARLDLLSIRNKLTLAFSEALSVYGEAEQELREADKRLLALGGQLLSTTVERLHAIAGLDQQATAASLGVEYTPHPLLKGTGRIEWRRAPSADSWLSTVGVARKLSRDWTMLSKNYYQRLAPRSGREQMQGRSWFGAAYRETERNRVNLLSRYESASKTPSGNRSAPAPGGRCTRCRHTWTSIRRGAGPGLGGMPPNG
jgi:hypothetical protein